MITIKELNKTYTKSNVVAVRNVSFEINNNEIFALLGPNGAGKTTTMRMLSTLLTPTSGSIYYDGIPIKGNENNIRRKIGFLTNEIRLDGQFTPNELVQYYGKLYNMTESHINTNKNKLFSYFGIDKYADRKYENFSTGMKQKTSIAVCLIHDPDVIIFDEPTNGLDILTQRLIEDYILKMKEEGKCIIISTHILEVVEKLADRVGVIIDGKSVFCGTCNDMVKAQNTTTLSDAFISLYKANHSEEPAVQEPKKKSKFNLVR